MILDFLAEVVRRPTVLVGNSVGSLACVIAASGSNPPILRIDLTFCSLLKTMAFCLLTIDEPAESTGDAVRGLVLLNCAGGMNNKAIVDDWRIKLLLPLLWLIDFLLKQRPIASALFERVKNRQGMLLI